MAVNPENGQLGAYGLRLGHSLGPAWLTAAAPEWPAVEVDLRTGTPRPVADRITDSEAQFSFANGGSLHVSAGERRAVFTRPEPMTVAELVHPYLAPIGATFARWWGREAFHAGAFVADDRAFAVIGDKGAGKSTMLAWLSTLGHEIVSDDMLVIDDGHALAGPRCIDLRESAAAHLAIGELTLRPPEPRWRVTLGPARPSTRLAGWVFLAWGDELECARVTLTERLPFLAANRSLLMTARDPVALLDLAALPMWNVRMPQDWDALGRAAEQVVALTTAG